MSISNYILPYYENEPITKKLVEAVDKELADIRKFLAYTYPIYIQTDFIRAWSYAKEGNPIPYVYELHADLERTVGRPIQLVAIKQPDSKQNEPPNINYDVPRLLYAANLLYTAINTPLSPTNLQEFINSYTKAVGLDSSKWKIDKTDLETRDYLRITVTAPDNNDKIEMVHMQNFLSRILPAHIVIEVIQSYITWEMYETEDENEKIHKWSTLSGTLENPFTWEYIKRNVVEPVPKTEDPK
jgi:hypothetical protein